jgi:hypothetical protein
MLWQIPYENAKYVEELGFLLDAMLSFLLLLPLTSSNPISHKQWFNISDQQDRICRRISGAQIEDEPAIDVHLFRAVLHDKEKQEGS